MLPALDQNRIHQLYTDGDFEAVIAAIDSFTRARKAYGHGDCVFIAKHLAVIYAVNPATREMGKGYIFRLLALLPSAKIVDMFVSDEIDRIFEKVKEEYAVRRQSLGPGTPTHPESSRYAAERMTVDADADARPDPAPQAGPDPGGYPRFHPRFRRFRGRRLFG